SQLPASTPATINLLFVRSSRPREAPLPWKVRLSTSSVREPLAGTVTVRPAPIVNALNDSDELSIASPPLAVSETGWALVLLVLLFNTSGPLVMSTLPPMDQLCDP